MKNIFHEAQMLQDELVAMRRTLHAHPETGMELPQTAAFVKAKLEALGLTPLQVGHSGLSVTLGGGKSGKCILLRADMDALPLAEETGLDFASTNGCMHACGHDFHTTMLLGAAQILKNHQDELDAIGGTVKLMFQPGEEIITGASDMIARGVLTSPKVDAAMMLHVWAGLPLPCGTLIVPHGGVFTAAGDRFEVTVTGKGGHGAMPERCVDPILTASHLYVALQSLISREIPSRHAAVISAGSIRAGDADNTIPDTCTLTGTIRTYNKRTREYILKRMREICVATGDVFRSKVEVAIDEGCPSVVVDDALADVIRLSLIDAFGEAAINPSEYASVVEQLSFSEDFAFITEKVPSVILLLSAGNPDEGYVFSQHHPKVQFNEAILAKGAAIYAISALSYLNG